MMQELQMYLNGNRFVIVLAYAAEKAKQEMLLGPSVRCVQ